MYKCIANGKTNFTSNPKDAQGNCQPMELNVPQPNPVDVSRGMERLRDYEKEKQAYSEKSRKSKELDPDAQRRAQSAELAKSVAKAPIPSAKIENTSRKKKNN
jgi:hypothetical protein